MTPDLDQLKRDLVEFLGAEDPKVKAEDLLALHAVAMATNLYTGNPATDAVLIWRMVEQLRQNGLPEDLRLPEGEVVGTETPAAKVAPAPTCCCYHSELGYDNGGLCVGKCDEPDAAGESGVQRCRGCRHWRAIDPSDFKGVEHPDWGICSFPHKAMCFEVDAINILEGLFYTRPAFGCVEFAAMVPK